MRISKRIVFMVVVTILALGGTIQNASAQVPRNVVLEFCTGTWCQWCPCGDQTAEALLATYPNLIVIAYHGAGSDPWQNFNGSAVRSMLGFSAYPTATIDRRNHPGGGGYPYVDYTLWTGLTSQRYSNAPTTNVDVAVVNQSYNASTRQFDLTVSATALATLSGRYKLSVLITEDSLVYPQTGNATCGYPPNDYIHEWVARSMVNGPAGDSLITGTWNQSQVLTRTFSTTLDLAWNANHCQFTVLVYKDSTNALYYSEIMQAIRGDVIGLTGVEPAQNTVPTEFGLSQNYPNPFNPSTTITMEIAKPGFVSLKVFDLLGKEVATLVAEEKQPGTYTVPFDASGLASGAYIYRLEAGSVVLSRKMVVMR